MAPIDHSTGDGASTPQSDGPRDAGKRTKDGCVVCRVRRKKCSGKLPEDPTSCSDCFSLSIICLGFPGARPRWMRNKERVREMKRRIKKWTNKRGVRDSFLDLSGYCDEIPDPNGAAANRSSAASGDEVFASASGITLPPGPPSTHGPLPQSAGSSGAVPGENGIISTDRRRRRPVRRKTRPSILTLDRSHPTVFPYPNRSSPPPIQDHAHGPTHPPSIPAADNRTQSYVFRAGGPNTLLGESVPQFSNVDGELGGPRAREHYIPPTSSPSSITMPGMSHLPLSFPVFPPQPHLRSPVSFPPVSGAPHPSVHNPAYCRPESCPNAPVPSTSSTQEFSNALYTAFMTDLQNWRSAYR